MEQVRLEEKYILEYIRDMLESCKTNTTEISDYRYHHNTSYKHMSAIIKNGLLSKKMQIELKNQILTEKEKELFIDEGHVNSLDCISLAVVGLDDLYPNEFEYNPFLTDSIDILISNNIKAMRNSENYGNEFLVQDKIYNKEFRSIDIRLLKCISEVESEFKLSNIEKLIEKYNYLSEISQSLLENNLDIPMRDMSFGNKTLDKQKVRNLPKLGIK